MKSVFWGQGIVGLRVEYMLKAFIDCLSDVLWRFETVRTSSSKRKSKEFYKSRLWLSFGMILGISIGCGSRNEQQSTHKSFIRTQSRWMTLLLDVCWEGNVGRFSAQKNWVRDKVEYEFELKTALRFFGWGPCHEQSRGIRIGVSDEVGSVPHTKGLGREISSVPSGMVLNFTFRNWGRACLSDVKKCIESVGVHEFGHAVGLAHEQNRPDTPRTCDSVKQGEDGDMAVGSWDASSVMNYCNPVYNNGGSLSSGDLRGIRQLYSR